MRYLINNTTKQVFGFDENQNYLLKKYIKDGDFIECRLPTQFEVWDSDAKDWVLDKSEEDKYDTQKLISKAKDLLAESDYMVLFDRYNQYTKEQQEAIVTYRAQLRNVVRGESTELPKLSFN